MEKIGFIGLGHMGNPMVKNLIKNNFKVVVYDAIDDSIKRLIAVGAIGASTVAEVVLNSDIVITMLQTGQQVKSVTTDTQGIFEHLKPEGLFIDCSSIDVESSRALHGIASERHRMMVDAPVSGGVLAAEKGTLTFMVGGAVNAFEKALPILQAMGKMVIHAGAESSGVAAKICNNMLLAISMIGVSEAFILADKLGLSPQKLFEISSNASGQCWSLTQYCPWPDILPNVPSSKGYAPGFTAQMMLKDLMLSQEAAKAVDAFTPLGQHAMSLYQELVEQNHGHSDFSAILPFLKDLRHKK